jgi:hypothetical protein
MSGMLTPLVIAKEALIALENECVLGNLVYRGASEFAQHVGATVNYRQPSIYTATVVSNTVNAATVAETSVAVVLNRLADVTLSVTSQDLSLEVVDFSEQFIQPALRAHAQLLDLYGALEASNWAGHATVTGTPAAADIVQIGAVLDAQKAPSRDRRLVMGPMTKAGYMVLEPFLYAEHRADGGRAMREAEMGRVLGFDCYMDQNAAQTHTSGAMGDLAGAMKGAGAAADTSATVDGITSGGTVLAGDVFKITGYDQWFRVTTNATANVATIVVAFSPALGQTVAASSVVTFQGTGRDNMAFHKNAMGLFTAPLEAPMGGAKGAVVTYKGLSCRVVYDYSIMTKTNIMSIDMLYGWKTLNKDLAARLIDQRSI